MGNIPNIFVLLFSQAPHLELFFDDPSVLFYVLEFGREKCQIYLTQWIIFQESSSIHQNVETPQAPDKL